MLDFFERRHAAHFMSGTGHDAGVELHPACGVGLAASADRVALSDCVLRVAGRRRPVDRPVAYVTQPS